ncbi:MAG: hypothetical protein B6D61_01565 [Bacteroidetes bacterium 4484_249]|nr:MAG: hypothetical protein B6D61_01565 [Bacteroidetes bacterium 4484_249]
MIKKFAFIFFLLGLIYSCSHEPEKSLATISGNIPGLSGKWIYLEELEVKNKKLLDSVRISEHGKFNFEVELQDAGFYILRTNEDNYLILLLEKNEYVEVKSSSDTLLMGSKIIGSEGSKLLLNFEVFMKMQKQRVDSLAEVFYASRGDADFLITKQRLDSVYNLIYNDQRNYVIDFVNKNPGSLATLIVINRKLGNNAVLDEEKDYKYFRETDSVLMNKYPENKHVADHHNRVTEIKTRIYDKFMADRKLKPGNKAPNIVLKDTSGKFISLRDLQGQKLLLYFWAGWNAKSRQDNRKLITVYDKLKRNKIEIFGVSLDENEKVWKGAVKIDKLPWIQGSDILGVDSPVNEKYNLNMELPFYYFLDEDRKIIFREKDVENVIDRLLNDNLSN